MTAPDRAAGRRARVGMVAGLTFALLAGGCGSDHAPESRAEGTAVTTSAPDGPPTTSVPGGQEAGVEPVGTLQPRPAPSSSVPPPAAGSRPKAVAGHYRYKVTGTRTVGTPQEQKVDEIAELTVQAPEGNDQRSVLTSSQGDTERTNRYEDDGVYLVALKLAGVGKEFRPRSPGLVYPRPARPGDDWSWSATSTDGKTELRNTFTVVRAETIMVGDEVVPAVVLDVSAITSGDVSSKSEQRIWVAQTYGLIVRTDDTTTGRSGALSFSSTTSSRLLSTKPS